MYIYKDVKICRSLNEVKRICNKNYLKGRIIFLRHKHFRSIWRLPQLQELCSYPDGTEEPFFDSSSSNLNRLHLLKPLIFHSSLYFFVPYIEYRIWSSFYRQIRFCIAPIWFCRIYPDLYLALPPHSLCLFRCVVWCCFGGRFIVGCSWARPMSAVIFPIACFWFFMPYSIYLIDCINDNWKCINVIWFFKNYYLNLLYLPLWAFPFICLW